MSESILDCPNCSDCKFPNLCVIFGCNKSKAKEVEFSHIFGPKLSAFLAKKLVEKDEAKQK